MESIRPELHFLKGEKAKENRKMYILVRENLPPGFDIVGAAHAAMCAYMKFQKHPETQKWANDKWYKVICKVSDKEFENAKKVRDHVVITEDTLDNMELAIGFRPRKEWPTNFKFFQLYK